MTTKTRAPRQTKRVRLKKRMDIALGQLEYAQLIRPSADLALAEDITYIFKHVLVQDTVHASLLKTDRKQLHRQVAQALEFECRTDLDEIAARLAQHYTEAGDHAKALEFAKRAGDRAARVYALTEAVTYYTQALQLALADAMTSSQTLIDLYRARGQALYSNGRDSETWQNYLEMEQTALERRDQRLLLYNLLERAVLRVAFSSLFDPEDAQNLTERALALAEGLDDRAALAKLYWVRMGAVVRGRLGMPVEAERAVEDGERSLKLAQELGLREQYAYTLSDLQYVYSSLGRFAKALGLLESARTLWREIGNQHMVADNLNQTAGILFSMGDLDQSEQLAKQALTLSQQTSNKTQEMTGALLLGILNRERGKISWALEQIHHAQSSGRQSIIGPTTIALAQIYQDIGLIPDAIGMLEAALPQMLEFPLGKVFANALYAILVRLKLYQGDIQQAKRTMAPIADAYQNWNYLALANGAEVASFAAAELALATGKPATAQDILAKLIAVLEKAKLVKAIPEARLLQARVWSSIQEWDKAYMALAQARAEAEGMRLRRLLWQILAALCDVERQRGNIIDANGFHTQARTELEFIVEHMPQEFRESFLNQPRVREVMA